MKKIILAILSLAFLAGIGSAVKAQAGLTPAAQTMQNELIKNFETTGYGDYEIDLIHKKIALLVGKMTNQMEKDDKGEQCLKLEVTAGESLHPNGSRFIIHGYAYLYPSGEPGKLGKIVMEYIKQNASGAKFRREKRILVNPTPYFIGENSVDSNNDIQLTYFSVDNDKEDFKKIRDITFSEMDRHDRKKMLIGAYKNYLRKTLHSLEWNITSIELSKVSELLYMLEFE